MSIIVDKAKFVDGLSVERLTLLGRVHVARVSIDALTLDTEQDISSSSRSSRSSKLTRKGKPPRPSAKLKKPW